MVSSRNIKKLPHLVLAQLGEVLTKSSLVEFYLRLLIKDIHGKGYDAGMSLTSEASNFDRIKRVWLDIKEGKIDKITGFSDSDTKEVESLIEKRACAWAGIRNSIHHSLWMADATTGELVTTCKKPPKKEFERFFETSGILISKIEGYRRPRFHDKKES